jgi:hypothetical protein
MFATLLVVTVMTFDAAAAASSVAVVKLAWKDLGPDSKAAVAKVKLPSHTKVLPAGRVGMGPPAGTFVQLMPPGSEARVSGVAAMPLMLRSPRLCCTQKQKETLLVRCWAQLADGRSPEAARYNL